MLLTLPQTVSRRSHVARQQDAAAAWEKAAPDRPLSTTQPTVPEWGEALRGEITTGIDGALLHAREGVEARRAFLVGLIDTLRFDRGNGVLGTARVGAVGQRVRGSQQVHAHVQHGLRDR